MKFLTSSKFKRQYRKLPQKIKTQFSIRMEIFQKDEFNPMLKNHKLTGEYSAYRSINITGDYRLVYTVEDKGIYLVTIGTHSELYS